MPRVRRSHLLEQVDGAPAQRTIKIAGPAQREKIRVNQWKVASKKAQTTACVRWKRSVRQARRVRFLLLG